MKRTKILATYGPAIARAGLLKNLISAGVNAFRINCSYGRTNDFLNAARAIRAASKGSRWPIGLLFDISGPKLRLDQFGGKLDVSRGTRITLRYGKTDLAKGVIGVNHKAVIGATRKGQRLFVDDGNIMFDVVQADRGRLELKAQNPGVLLGGKGINLPDTKLPVPTIGTKDRDDIKTAVRVDADYIALSFVRSAADIEEAKRLVKKLGGRQLVFAKLEKREAVDHLEEIIELADGVMVARGDLGVELPPAEIPKLQKRIIKLANYYQKPVIVATQMLESMRFSPRATRAEVNDVATAVFDLTDAVMLSAETATGKYPLEAVQTMADVCETTEAALTRPIVEFKKQAISSDIPLAIAESVNQATDATKIKCIFAFTTSGFTAGLISNLYPLELVIALTPDRKVMSEMSLVRSVYPVKIDQPGSFEETVTAVNSVAKKFKLARRGDKVVITGGAPFGSTVYTNFMMIHKVS